MVLGGCPGSVEPPAPTPPDSGAADRGTLEHPPPGAGSEVDLETLPHPACPDPAPTPGRFHDGLPGSGVDFVHASDPAFTSGDELEMPFAEVTAAGLAVADFDDDGEVDLFFTQMVGANALYWGLGGGGWERADDGPWALPDDLTATARAVDVDGDGLLDLDVAGRDSVHFFRNLGGRRFEDVTAATGVAPREGWPGASAWADVDGDGDLDLFAGGYVVRALTFPGWVVEPTVHALWRNDGGVFTDRSGDFGFDYAGHDSGATIHAVFRDLDDDGDPDLLQVNDFGGEEGLTRPWENVGPDGDGWAWRDRGPDTGMGPLFSPMGVSYADLDGDGVEDLWFSDLGLTTVYRRLAPYLWTDVTLVWASGVENGRFDASWSTVPIDLDGDGVPSVYIAYGQLPPVFRGPDTPEVPQPDRFLVSQRTGEGTIRFTDRAADVFPDPQDAISRGAAVADLDRDGVPDLVVGHVRDPPSVLMGRCTAASRLVVAPRDDTTRNRFAVGARVTVEAGDLRLTDEVLGGGRGTFSSGEPVVFFGLGDARTVDRLEVRWPDGEVTEWTDVPAHARLTPRRRWD